MRVRVTERDHTLPHQIVLVRVGERMGVQCLCRPHENFAVIDTKTDPWPEYNKTENHNNSKELFIPRPHHLANAKVYEIE